MLFVATGLVAPASLSAQTAPARALSLPALGDGGEMPIAAERRLGDRIARELYRDPDYLDDPVLTDYLQSLWQPLLAAALARGELSPELRERFAWQLLLGRDRSVNAFALPGGYFGVHLGLMAVVGSRDELASVLAHELTHVTQRHIARLISRQGQETPWMIGAMILGALAASRNADAGNALIVGGQAVAAQNQLNFSRDMEREADRLGLAVMTQAGFDGRGFVGMFDRLQQASRLNDSGAYPYLRSHPLTTERIADMQQRQLLQPDSQRQAGSAAEHALIAARARVLANPGVDALRAWLQEASGTELASQGLVREAAALYGAALAASRLREFGQARALVQRLLARVRHDSDAFRLAQLLQSEISLAQGEPEVPEQWSESTRRPELMLWAYATLRSRPAQAAIVAQQMQRWLASQPGDAMGWQLLAQAYAAQGLSVRAIRAEAESQVARLEHAGALERLKAAQDLLRQESTIGTAQSGAAIHIEASIIDTRRRQLEVTLRELALER